MLNAVIYMTSKSSALWTDPVYDMKLIFKIVFYNVKSVISDHMAQPIRVFVISYSFRELILHNYQLRALRITENLNLSTNGIL